jgi:hypothetical protein
MYCTLDLRVHQCSSHMVNTSTLGYLEEKGITIPASGQLQQESNPS